tara:strand:+ start:2151 stop:2981 length:831 start_codon:yes stop_codon:yes gene_type:complete
MNKPEPLVTIPASLGELLPQILRAYDSEVLEYNEMCLEADNLQTSNTTLNIENSLLKEQVIKLTAEKFEIAEKLEDILGKVQSVQDNAAGHMNMLQQANRERIQAQDKLDQAVVTVASYKQLGTPKKIREQVKSYKEKASINIKAITTMKNEVKGYRRNKELLNTTINNLQATVAQTNIQSIWSNGKEHLMVFPSPLTLAINNKTEKQLTLLYMNQSGCGKLIAIDEDGEPVLCTMPKGGLKPKVATLEKAGSILRKFKQKNWKLSHQEIIAIQES